MSKLKIRYLVQKSGSRFYWQPSAELAKQGWRTRRLKRPDGAPIRGHVEAAAAAEALNAELDQWRRSSTEGPAQPAAERSLADAIAAYRASPRFARLAAKTRRDYDWCMRLLAEWGGPEPLAAIDRPAVLAFYEAIQPRRPAKANALVRVLRIVLGYAWDRGWVTANAARAPRLVGTAPRLRIWSEDEFRAIVAAADRLGWPSIGDAVWLARYTGQRQGDILGLTRLQCAGGRVRLKQAKRGAQVAVPFVPMLAARIAEAEARAAALAPASPALLICEATGRRWGADHFRHSFARARAAAALAVPSAASAWFMDLRDTAVTHLAEAGCTVPQIAAITGHGEASAHAVLKHYLALGDALAETAIAKLVEWEKGREGQG